MVNIEPIDSETLVDMNLPRNIFSVDGLITQGVTILAGPPKIGKSWLVLDICMQVAKGEPLWEMPTNQGKVLYLCLEDNYSRIQSRVNDITAEPSCELEVSVTAPTLNNGLIGQLESYCKENKNIRLIAIDTLQMVRDNNAELSYGNDYGDIEKFKTLADEFGISIILVHHLRKQGASDPHTMISGTTGLTGAADSSLVFRKDEHKEGINILYCRGRSIQERSLKLKFNRENCRWEMISDSLDEPTQELTDEMITLIKFMKNHLVFRGGNTELVEEIINEFPEFSTTPQKLKQQMVKFRYLLEEQGVYFSSGRSNGKRTVEISFCLVNSDTSDALNAVV